MWPSKCSYSLPARLLKGPVARTWGKTFIKRTERAKGGYTPLGMLKKPREESPILGIPSKVCHAGGKCPLTWESSNWNHVRVGSGENDQIIFQPPRTDLVILRDVGCWEMSPWVVGRTLDAHSWAFRRTQLNPTQLNVTFLAPIRTSASLIKRLPGFTTFER